METTQVKVKHKGQDGSMDLGEFVALPSLQLIKVLKVYTAALVLQGAVDGKRFSRQLLSGARRLRENEADEVMYNVIDRLAWIARAGGKKSKRKPKR